MMLVHLQGEAVKHNPEMEKLAVWAGTGCMAVSPISWLRFMSSPCIRQVMDATCRISIFRLICFYLDSPISLFSSRRRTGSGLETVTRDYEEIGILLNGDVRFDLSLWGL